MFSRWLVSRILVFQSLLESCMEACLQHGRNETNAWAGTPVSDCLIPALWRPSVHDALHSQRKEVEQSLWKHIFYRPIEEFRKRIKATTVSKNEQMLAKVCDCVSRSALCRRRHERGTTCALLCNYLESAGAHISACERRWKSILRCASLSEVHHSFHTCWPQRAKL